ncbi:uncharacterized protein Z519_02321 [Cladophialophora bantiana CBS 173.52]|uniref:Bacteriophage T5 Orf172 DNA-binding domain-containing protein n=1 Tax=Cladophialophora bantiana (strain ATCC 10958 / CBS 173.52 / CDC B-1940 / NIH 8579) TaxID=1442370 RepID=A0A0D2I181_CLAB1|nr:uncharacterized protein Z519_02321 [Cladophialophora bantiana CBS 173.52]KIW96930.1 hypothetical protein Z519_02321 [Cladophialophora bantiana CBS 173.52]
MSFSGKTPESLLPRSDSRNPATTCRGITSTGRPCRRPLAASPKNSPTPSPSRGNGVLAVLDEQSAAAFYCWQHKDQAEQLAAQAGRTSLHPLKERSSIDTLIEQVGILELDEDVPKRHHRRHDPQSVKRRDTLPSGWNQLESPLMTVPEEVVHHRRPKRPPPPPPKSNVKLSWACCIQADGDDDLPPARVWREDRDRRRQHHTEIRPSSSVRPEMRQSSTTPVRPKPSPAPSQTQTLLSLIPSNLSPQTTSQLLAELTRPISAADEAGYIYIFWLTPESEISKPDDETASSLLDDDDDDNEDDVLYSRRLQRTNHALARYASVRRPPNQVQPKRTITLKIGRAANVHRRMTQWTKQCGQNITLIRYYPHSNRAAVNTPTSTPPARGSASTHPPSRNSNKVSHVHKVERLIHLELSEKKAVKSECEQCGREHKEWFEIEATREGLRGVDEVVRRWVRWAARQ